MRTALLLCLLLSSCASWADTRREVVTPLNKLVHADYPKAIKARDASAVIRMFAPAQRAFATKDIQSILGRFSRIDRCRCVIHDSAAAADDGSVRTECVLRVDGVSLGEPLTWEQERVITAQPIDGR